MIKGWHLAVAGVVVLLIEFFYCWVPAAMAGGQLYLGPVFVLSVIGLGLIVGGTVLGGRKLNRETNGELANVLRFAGTAYLGYKVTMGAARHLHREITRE